MPHAGAIILAIGGSRTLLAIVPWALGVIVYELVAGAKRRRFGPEHARPPLYAREALLTMAAAMGGPLLLIGFVPRVIATRQGVPSGLTLLGVLFCWIPIGEVRKCLRER